jgi:uncharacterized cupin superfamily protein
MSEKQVSDIIVFQRHPLEVEYFSAPADRVVSGACEQSVENHYSDPSGQFHAGIWSGGVGCWRVQYSEHEFCTMLQGRVKVSDNAGQSVLLSAGDSFVIPAGFEGLWEVLEPASKTYAIFEAKPA